MKFEYNNRDLSWLTFNHRVLDEAKDKSIPLYERIKFLAIYSSNLEEFYRVRVSYYRGLLETLPEGHEKIRAINPERLILKINKKVSELQKEFEDLFINTILPELDRNGIRVVEEIGKLNEEQQGFIEKYFNVHLLPNLMPVVLHNRRIRPFLKTGEIYIAMRMTTKKGVMNSYGLLKLPRAYPLTRFVELPSSNDNYHVMFLEDIVMEFAPVIFPGYKIKEWYSIKMTRDADLDFDELEGEELIKTVSSLTTNRQIGDPNRFQIDRRMPENMVDYLCQSFGIERDAIVRGGRRHNFRDFFLFPNPKSPDLEIPKHVPARVKELENVNSIIQAFKEKDYLLHFPYQSYDYFIQFLNEAALNPDIEEIKATQYRVASKSAVVDALINAALHGKKVTVFVELKARFDEESNLRYAKEMKNAGINIIYSIAGLKVHSKIAMIISKENEKGKRNRYCFLGTGNFNEKTAKLYCDHGLFTSDKEIAKEIDKLFNYLIDQKHKPTFKHLLVPTFNMVETYTKLIDDEIANAKADKKSYILIKVNGMDDPAMIDKLYEASLAGVKVDCIIRGVCCLKTNQKYSKNIRVIRIIDGFLEHARVCIFYANGEYKTYIGSADWMRRNLYRRIECVFPIYNEQFKSELLDIYEYQLNDNVKGAYIGANMENERRYGEGRLNIRSQAEIYDYLVNKHS